MKYFINFSLLFLFIFYFIQPSSASVVPISVAQAKKTAAGGIESVIRFKNSANGKYYTKVVNISKSSVGSIIRNRMFTPYGALFTAAITAAGWYIDNQNQTVIDTSSTVSPPNKNPNYPRTYQQAYEYYRDNVCVGQPPGGYRVQRQARYVSIYCYKHPVNYPRFLAWIRFWELPNNYDPNWQPSAPPGPPPTITNDEIADIALPQVPDSNIIKLLVNPDTSNIESVPEITAAANEIQQNYDLLNDTDPTNDPDPGSVSSGLSSSDLQIQQSDALSNQLENAANNSGSGSGSGNEPPDYSHNFVDLPFPTDLPDYEKNAIEDVLDPLFNETQTLTDNIGLTATPGVCKVTTTWVMGGHTKELNMSFCMFESAFNAMGLLIYSIAALYSALILFGFK